MGKFINAEKYARFVADKSHRRAHPLVCQTVEEWWEGFEDRPPGQTFKMTPCADCGRKLMLPSGVPEETVPMCRPCFLKSEFWAQALKEVLRGRVLNGKTKAEPDLSDFTKSRMEYERNHGRSSPPF